MNTTTDTLWAPEIIKESSGIACGDALSIKAYRDEGKVYFSFYGNACTVAQKMSKYIESKYSGLNELLVRDEMIRLHEHRYLKSEKWIEENFKHSEKCVESPISLLLDLIEESSDRCDGSDNELLACDACVTTKKFNWSPNKKNNISIKENLRRLFTSDELEEREMQELGLCILDDKQQIKFRNKLASISDEDMKVVKKMRLTTLFYNNAMKYNSELDPKIVDLATKQIVSLAVASSEIEIINQFIKDNNLLIDSVKGGKTSSYYPSNLVRTHMDFDYLASKFDDGFKLISYLINKRGFKMVMGGSVPFSIKSILNHNGEEILTGHIHLEKILQDRYQVVVDINMGGFPLGRTGIIQCNLNGHIEVEDLICITVAHLFKHEYAFMKDINDLYYLLRFSKYNIATLIDKLKCYNLTNLFFYAYSYLKNNTDLNVDIRTEATYLISQKRKKEWPYSRKAHFYIKARDMLALNEKQYGVEAGGLETKRQIYGKSGKLISEKYKTLCPTLNDRTYLYPVVMFNTYFPDIAGVDYSDDIHTIVEDGGFLILPIGIFFLQNTQSHQSNRKLIDLAVNKLLNKYKIEKSDCNIDYLMEARRDIWLY